MGQSMVAFIEDNISKVAKKVEDNFNLVTVYTVYDTTVYIQLKNTILDIYEFNIEDLIKQNEHLEEHQLVNLIADNVIAYFINEMDKARDLDISLESIRHSLSKI